jgi:pilus assembly protein FimV
MKLRLQLFLLCTLAPAIVHALGLGKLELESALNEPFEARIELLSPTVEELDSLNVRLADEAAFSRAGIPRLSLLRSLNFVVKEVESGSDYIRVYSNEPIREPFLNFLLEVSWSKGRLYREYTVLLDPPVYASPEKQTRLAAPSTTPPAGTTGMISREIEDNQVVYDPVYKPSRTVSPAAPVTRPVSYDGGDYGPAATGDTLWSIASAMRPDSSVSVQQMMFALLRANPEAFINGNINGLKRGHVLKMPDMSDVRSLSKEEAFAQTRLQNGLWEEARGALATAVTPRPEVAVSEEPVSPPEEPVVTPEPVTAPPVEEGEPELRLVAPAEAGEGTGGVTDTSSEQLANELALATESLEALTQENLELKDKLSETEAIIDDLKRLIVLKETELAALQQQIAAEEAARVAAAEQQQAVTEAAPAQETAVEKPVAAAEKSPAQPSVQKETAGAETPSREVEGAPADTASSSLIPPAVAGIVDVIRNNLMYLGMALGGLLLIGLGIAYVKRRQSEAAIEIPQSAFPDFDQEIEASREDATDINPALADSEAITVLPDSEDETSMPEFEKQEATVISPSIPAEKKAPPPQPSAVTEEEDPFTEVNYFLAYEQYDQAEELVKKIIAKDPSNLESHTKLLEVYYAANNKKGYEQAARVLHDKVHGQGDYWSMAVAMWQEISPNRALFAESAGDEEDRGAAATAGGIVNIAAGDESAPAGLDFDLDTTASGANVLEMATEDSGDTEADILDVTAAIDMDDDAVLDVTAATDSESEETVVRETRSADDNSLDFDFDLEKEEPEAVADSGMDISLDETQEASAVAAADDNSLDFSIDLDKEESRAGALDISLDTGQEEKEVAGTEDNSLDFSIDFEKEESRDEIPEISLDMSLDNSRTEESAPAGDDNSLDFSFDLEQDENKLQEPAPDVLDTSFNVTDDEKTGKADLLDVTSAISLDNDEESMEVETGAQVQTGADLLDVTKTRTYAPDNDADLLDVTAATSASMDGEELLDSTKAGAAAEAEDNLLDFELSPDDAKGDEPLSEIAFDGIDITAGQGNSETGIDFSIDTGTGGNDEPEIDMEGTMQMPKRAALELDTEPDETPSDSEFELVLDEEDDDAHTIMVPRSAGTAQQSEEDEIASQLDLAKAYVELGDADNAKTILNEIIAVGNAEQQRQARELLGQI